MAEGVPTVDVQKLTRHALYKATMDIYRYLLPDQLEKGLRHLNNTLQSIEKSIEKKRSANSR
jgi:hypothetical protein